MMEDTMLRIFLYVSSFMIEELRKPGKEMKGLELKQVVLGTL